LDFRPAGHHSVVTEHRRSIVILGGLVVLVAVGALVGLILPGKGPSAAPLLPRCGRPAHIVPRPAVLPKSFPLPAGTVFTGVDRTYPGSPVVSGRMPLELGPAGAFFARRLAAAGFTTRYGEQEVGYEFESAYQRPDVSGRFKVRILFQCRGATRFWISAHRA
jgi:hypothetical protein